MPRSKASTISINISLGKAKLMSGLHKKIPSRKIPVG
jgi:hypothetical protein